MEEEEERLALLRARLMEERGQVLSHAHNMLTSGKDEALGTLACTFAKLAEETPGMKTVVTSATAYTTAVEVGREVQCRRAMSFALHAGVGGLVRVEQETAGGGGAGGDGTCMRDWMRMLSSAEEAAGMLGEGSDLGIALQERAGRQRETLQDGARRALTEGVQTGQGDDVVLLCRAPQMNVLWQQAEAAGVAAEASVDLSTQLLRDCIDPAIVESPSLVEASTTWSPDGQARFQLGRENSSSGGEKQKKLSAVAYALQYICEAICGGNKEAISMLGKVLWPGTVKTFADKALVIMTKVSASVAESAKCAAYLSSSAAEAEQVAAQTGLTGGCSPGNLLIARIHEVLLQQAKAYRTTLTSHCRNSLYGGAGAGGGGKEALIPVGKDGQVLPEEGGGRGDYSVSFSSIQLMKYVKEAFDDARVATEAGAPVLSDQLINVGNDALDLLATSRMARSSELDTVPQLAIIFSNDLRRAASLGPKIALEALPASGVKKSQLTLGIAMAARAARLLQIAAEMVSRVVLGFRDEIRESLGTVSSFRNSHHEAKADALVKAFARVAHTMMKFKENVIVLLPKHEAGRCVRDLLDYLGGEVSGKIMALNSLDAAECQALRRIGTSLTEGVVEAIGGPCPDIEGARGWQRLTALVELIDTPVRSIAAKWRSGYWQQFFLEVEEVKSIIVACFQDSSLRQEIIGSLSMPTETDPDTW